MSPQGSNHLLVLGYSREKLLPDLCKVIAGEGGGNGYVLLLLRCEICIVECCLVHPLHSLVQEMDPFMQQTFGK